MSEKILTAEEWLLQHKELSYHDVAEFDEGGYLGVNEQALYKIMNEYAKFIKNAALQAAAEQAEIVNKPEFKGDYNPVVDEDLILNAYPDELIK